jgi:hypothetical protein
MCSLIGVQKVVDVPFSGQLWAKATFTARFEPPVKEFRLTANKGTMEAGTRVFPFKIIYTPTAPRPSVALLVVVFNDRDEYVVECTGAVGGFQGRGWAKRQRRGEHTADSRLSATVATIEESLDDDP